MSVVEGLRRARKVNEIEALTGALTVEERQALERSGLGSKATDKVFDKAFAPSHMYELLERARVHQASLRRGQQSETSQ